jgi:hypothetical protein
MYETLMHTLRSLFGTGVMRTCLVIALALVVPVLALNCSGAFKESWSAWRLRRGWRGSLSALASGIFKFLLIFLLARTGISALTYQSGLFSQAHGRITGRNRSAVLMKWGYPHEQREMSVNHTRKRIWATRQLQPQKKDSKIVTESYWKDLEPSVRAIHGQIPAVVSTTEETRSVGVSQKSIVSADINIELKNNPRRLGNANYAGYNDKWDLRYLVANRSRWDTTARLSFPLPASAGLFDRMYVRIDGEDAFDRVKSSGNSITWNLTMPPGSTNIVEIGYQSRGLEHLRYIPKRMSRTGHYRVKLAIEGVPSDMIDYPIGSMPPAEDLTQITGTSYKLTWKLDNALTSYDIGIKLPLAEQPDYHFAHLLSEAPVGLVFLFLLLTLPRIILGVRVHTGTVTILGVAYCLHYTFMGQLASVLSGFIAPFSISAGIMLALVACFRLRGASSWPVRLLDVAVFATAILLYPLAVVDAERTGLWIQILWLGALTLSCSLLVSRRLADRLGNPAPKI